MGGNILRIYRHCATWQYELNASGNGVFHLYKVEEDHSGAVSVHNWTQQKTLDFRQYIILYYIARYSVRVPTTRWNFRILLCVCVCACSNIFFSFFEKIHNSREFLSYITHPIRACLLWISCVLKILPIGVCVCVYVARDVWRRVEIRENRKKN